jgi:hypothetical protein
LSIVAGLTLGTLGLSVLPESAAGAYTWTKLSPSSHPAARYYSAMAYDEESEQLVLFGGYSDATDTFFGDTWAWNGITWTQQTPTHNPPVRTGAALAYDSVDRTLILFGGFSPTTGTLSDTWSWDGSDWTQLAPAHHPSERGWAGMATSPTTGRPLLFGGHS